MDNLKKQFEKSQDFALKAIKWRVSREKSGNKYNQRYIESTREGW